MQLLFVFVDFDLFGVRFLVQLWLVWGGVWGGVWVGVGWFWKQVWLVRVSLG